MFQALRSRHALLNADLKTAGYQLCFYSSGETEADQQSAGFNQLEGTELIFIDKEGLDALLAINSELHRERIMLNFNIDYIDLAEFIAEVQQYKQQGFKIAFTLCNDSVIDDDLLPVIDLIKLDALAHTESSIKDFLASAKQYQFKVCVDKIESYGAFEHFKALGIDYFQGSFVTSPKEKAGGALSGNGLMTMKLLSTLQDIDVKLDDVEAALSQDPRLVYKLLRVVNSPAFGVSREIDSLRQAVVFVGLSQLKRWAALLSLANVEGKPQELMITAMVRAKMCELLAEHRKLDDSSSYYMLGLLSTLDALFDKNMQELLETLPLADNMKAALSGGDGSMGQLLNEVVQYEQQHWPEVTPDNNELKQLSYVYFESVNWADDYVKSLR